MNILFLRLLNMSITGTYVIIVIMILRLLMNRFPKKYSYLLWSVAGFRLCCPVSFESVFSLFSLKPFDMSEVQNSNNQQLSYVSNHIAEAQGPKVNLGVPAVTDAVNQGAWGSSPMGERYSVLTLLACVWLAVSVLMLIYAVISFVITNQRMRTAVKLEKGIYESDRISTPFIIGTKIYLPCGLDNKTKEYVLAHEKHHIKRLDFIVKPFAYILLCAHWFNPFVWLAFYLMSKDMEMSCDEAVLSKNKGIKKLYSTALLFFASNKKFPAPSPLAFSEGGVKERIKNVLRFKKPKLWLSITALVLCLAVMVGCSANPVVDKIEEITVRYSDKDTHRIWDSLTSPASSTVLDVSNTPKEINVNQETLTIYGENYKHIEKAETIRRSEFIKELSSRRLFSKEALLDFIPETFNELTGVTYENDAVQYTVLWYKDMPMWLMDSTELHLFRLVPNLSYRDLEYTIDRKLKHLQSQIDDLQTKDFEDYLAENRDEYNTLLYYGDYMLRYAYDYFMVGSAENLKSRILLYAMDDLLGDERPDVDELASDQMYFDEFKKKAKTEYSECLAVNSLIIDFQIAYPCAYLLLYGMDASKYEVDEKEVVRDYKKALRLYNRLHIPTNETDLFLMARDNGATDDEIADLEVKAKYYYYTNKSYSVIVGCGFGVGGKDNVKCIEYTGDKFLSPQDYLQFGKSFTVGMTMEEFYQAYGKDYVHMLMERSNGETIIELYFTTNGSGWVKNSYTFRDNKLVNIQDTYAENQS